MTIPPIYYCYFIIVSLISTFIPTATVLADTVQQVGLDRATALSSPLQKVAGDYSSTPAPETISAALIRKNSRQHKVFLRSHIGVVYDLNDQEIIFQRNADRRMPIASLTKLMTAMVILDAHLDMDEIIQISKKDKDRILYAKSRLRFGTKLARSELLLLALLASENRAAAALARTYPGGTKKFVRAMNRKAKALGLKKTRFVDPAGLHSDNVSTANDLVKLALAANQYPMIRQYTTLPAIAAKDEISGKSVEYRNTNRLLRNENWKISLSKTGFTNAAGNCLLMITEMAGRPVVLVLLNSWGKLSKYGDSNRLKKWMRRTLREVTRMM